MLRVVSRFFNPVQYKLSSKPSDFQYEMPGGARIFSLRDWPSALHARHYAEVIWNDDGIVNLNKATLGSRPIQGQYKKKSSFSLTYKV